MTNHRGAVRKVGDGWGFRFSIAVDGRRRWIERQSKNWTRKDAQREMLAAMTRADAGHEFGTSKESLANYLRAWLEIREKSGKLKATTIGTMRIHVERYLVPAIGEIRLGDLKPTRLEQFYGELLESGAIGRSRRGKGEGLSPKMVRNIHGTLRKALGDAVRKGIIASNPADRVDLPRWDRPEMEAWSRDESGEFLASCYANADPMFPIWLLLLSTGLRRGEVCGLRWGDVDLVESSITIRTTRVIADGRGVIESTPKSKAGGRVVVIDPMTRDALARLKDDQEGIAGRLGLPAPEFVAVDLDGRVIHPQTIVRRFQQAREAAGLRPIKFHEARHSHASQLLDAGESIVVVSRRLGHSRVSTTLDIYAHRLPSADRDLADRWGSTMREAIERRART